MHDCRMREPAVEPRSPVRRKSWSSDQPPQPPGPAGAVAAGPLPGLAVRASRSAVRRPLVHLKLPVGRWAAVAVLFVLLALAVWEGDLPEAFGEASLTALAWLQQHGPVAAVFALYVEESGVPLLLPGDVFVMYIGRHASGPLGWLAAWLAVIAAVVLGATNLYWIARKWGRGVLGSRLGRAVHLTPERVARAERWFARYGAWALIFGRHVPGFRVPITIAAGTLQVRYPVFAASVAVSTATWAAFFLFIGISFGGRVADFLGAHRLNYVIVPVVLALLALVYVARVLILKERASGR